MRPFKSILDDWQDWPVTAQPILVKKYSAGLNHETALLSDGRNEFVLKRFKSSPGRQIEAQLWAASLGIAPEIIFAPPSHEYVLMEALSGDPLEIGHITDAYLEALAQSLSVMHRAKPGPRSTEGFDIRSICEGYLNKSDSEAMHMHQELKPILKLFKNDPTPWVFCHNDLVKANCFINGETAQFIDWEYADLHNPWFDLAAIIYYFALNDDQSRTLIAAYNNDWEIKVSEPIFYAAQIALLWCDMLWHLDKFGRDYWSKLGKKRSRIYRLALHLDVNFADA